MDPGNSQSEQIEWPSRQLHAFDIPERHRCLRVTALPGMENLVKGTSLELQVEVYHSLFQSPGISILI